MEHWNDKPLGLKAFLDELSREELIRTFIKLGAERPPQERRAFLRHIAELAEGREEPDDPSRIHASAERLAEQVRARWRSIEDMSYWQEYAPYEEDDPFYDGDFPPAMTSAQREELLALLIAARLGDTFQIARSTQSVGWTTGESAGALCFAAILAYRARSSLEHYPTIRRLLSQHVTQTWSSSSRFISTDPDEEDDESSVLPASVEAESSDKAGHPGVGSGSRLYERFDTQAFLARAVREGVTASRLSSETEQAYIAWAEKIGRRRVDHIVSNKHRGAYARAAQVVVALAELRLAAGNAGEAHELMASYRQTYKRYSAFRRDLSTVLEWSPLGGKQP
jgi:hypothetical protein